MTRIQIKYSALCIVALTMSGALAQQQQASNNAPPQTTIKSTAQEVVLDVIVRDKKGKAMKDLEPADVEVTDNGATQTIKGFRLVEGKEAISKGATVPLDPLRQIRLVTLTFERLGNDGRRLARQAALDLIKGSQAQNVFYSVMVIDQQLSVLQQFTSDRELLKKAVEKATSGAASASYAADSEQIRKQLQDQLGPQNGGQSVGQQLDTKRDEAQRLSGAAGAQAGIEVKMAEVMLNMLQFSESIANEQSGRMSIFGLLSLVRGQMSLPGRKTILYFTEGMRIPVNLDVPFQNVISTANRANVSFYPVDARGLTTSRENAAAISEMASAAASSKSQAQQTDGAVRRDQVMAQDTAQESLRANDRSALMQLAEGTGGFLIANTNDLRNPLRHVDEDINSYYEITYSPGIETYDGSFRKTAVHVNRADAKVQARSGYFALPPTEGGTMLQPFEVPLLTALGANPLPRNVEFHATALHFRPAREGQGSAAILIEVPLKDLKFVADAEKTKYNGRLSVLALLKDSSGKVVQKWSKDLPIQAPADKLAAIQMGNFIYKEHFSVPPGRYTLETAVIDHEAAKVGARKAIFVETSNPKGVGMSNISLIRRFEPNAKDLDSDDPFQFQKGRITPTLASSVQGGKGAMLSMFFVVYPDPAIAEKPQVVIEYIKDGASVGRGALELPAADAKGTIPYVMSSSAEAMPPGTYEVRAVVKQGATFTEERTLITIEAPRQ